MSPLSSECQVVLFIINVSIIVTTNRARTAPQTRDPFGPQIARSRQSNPILVSKSTIGIRVPAAPAAMVCILWGANRAPAGVVCIVCGHLGWLGNLRIAEGIVLRCVELGLLARLGATSQVPYYDQHVR